MHFILPIYFWQRTNCPGRRIVQFHLEHCPSSRGKVKHTHTKIRLQLKSNYKYITILDMYPGRIQQGTFSERQHVTIFKLLPCVFLTVPLDLECVLNNTWQPLSERERSQFMSHDGVTLIVLLLIYFGGWPLRNIKSSSCRLLNKVKTQYLHWWDSREVRSGNRELQYKSRRGLHTFLALCSNNLLLLPLTWNT